MLKVRVLTMAEVLDQLSVSSIQLHCLNLVGLHVSPVEAICWVINGQASWGQNVVCHQLCAERAVHLSSDDGR